MLSVSDKTGIVELAQGLANTGIELFSTGGTAKVLTEAGIPVKEVSDVTGFPEIMQGRVKTLHPKIFGGILAKRDAHAEAVKKHDLPLIDIVVCNLYPFAKTIAKPNVTFEEAIENIDIGGPSMVRAAAKNFAFTAVLVDPSDYTDFLHECAEGISEKTRKHLSAKAFSHTAEYDAFIANYLNHDTLPDTLNLSYQKICDLRYGENPHQQASVYSDGTHGILQAEQLQGKPLSYNNIADSQAALACVSEFTEPACVVVKHANPCGVASKSNLDDAFTAAWQADSESAFGGIVALNRPCTKAIANFLKTVFFEVLIAPDFEPAALEVLNSKKNLRVLKLANNTPPKRLLKSVSGGIIVQTPDLTNIEACNLTCTTKAHASEAALKDGLFAWKVVKHVKSNGILIAKDLTTLGIGPGQVSRVNAVKIALDRAAGQTQDAVLASDAFFPFRDNIDLLAESGIKTIIQPGGSIKDPDVIAACDEHGIAMLFTGTRCFTH